MALKTVDDRLPLRDRCITVDQIDAAEAKARLGQFDEAILHLPVFNENEGSFAPFTNALQYIHCC
jgi:hypothetical protein